MNMYNRLYYFMRSGPTRYWSPASKELGVNLILSVSPIWLGALIYHAATNDAVSLFSSFYHVTRQGELFLYCASILAPVIYLLGQEWNKGFPRRLLLGTASVVALIIAAGFFGFQRGAQDFNQQFVFMMSAIIFGISLVIQFISLVSKYFLENANPYTEMTKTAEEKMINALGNAE